MSNYFYSLIRKLFSGRKNKDQKRCKANDLLNEYKVYLSELKQLISATQNDYEILYLQLIVNVKNHFTTSPDIFKLSLQHSIIILKIRRGFMLPTGSDAETCYQEQDSWTYALFSAALLKNCFSLSSFQLELIEKLMPATGLAWLKANDFLFQEWLTFLKEECSKKNTFYSIISHT